MKVSELIQALQNSLDMFGDGQSIRLEIEHCDGKRSTQQLFDVLSQSNGNIVLASKESMDADPLLQLPVIPLSLATDSMEPY